MQNKFPWKTIIILLCILILCLVICIGAALLLTKTQQQCTYEGKVYNIGDGFSSTDGCNSCSCTNNGVTCTLMACDDTGPGIEETGMPEVTNTNLPTATPIATPGVSITGNIIQIYFGKPNAENDYTTLVPVLRGTDATGLSQFPFVLTQLMTGPTEAEKTSGITGVMTLTGSSTCGGSSYQYSKSGSKLTVKFCKNIAFVQNPGSGGAYAGMSLAGNARIYNALSQSLKINGVTTVIIRQSDDSCFAKDAGVNTACTD